MDDFNWDASPILPLSADDVWTLMQAGCRAGDIAAAAGVSLATALGMMNQAVPRAADRGQLSRAA